MSSLRKLDLWMIARLLGRVRAFSRRCLALSPPSQQYHDYVRVASSSMPHITGAFPVIDSLHAR